MKSESLVIVGQPYDGEFVPGPCTHRPSHYGSWQREVLYGSAIAAMVCLYGRILSFTIFCDPPFITLDYFADEIGVLSPSQLQVEELYAGEVGYLSASIRTVADARVGDTVTHYGRKADNSLPRYEEATPMVSCGLFPVDADQFPDLCDALEKLQLNDAALKFEPETSSAMGFGFICGFLGLLHMEIVQERLEREYNLSLITTAPSVVYRVHCVNGDTVECSNPSLLPKPGKRKSIEEPFVKMVGDFFDQLKSRSKGYASMEYTFVGYTESNLIKLDIRINGDCVEPLATIVHNNKIHGVVEDKKGRTVATLFGTWDESLHYVIGGNSGKGKGSSYVSTKPHVLWKRSPTPEYQTRYNEMQQQARKVQEKGWKPRWFAKEKGSNSYRYVGGYWETREKGNWESCPDIFGQVSTHTNFNPTS
ncbi:Translation factor GUF1-like, chloroplastic [Glycine soja]|uniref:Translation factor GUF1-like, chloroplastic n=1 Tax=Glycine soja TaxID=3848 RepID=A0A445L1C9_GLYSO|nr:Translation factor GUF1-like, chloroplastic [Glycine soja]